MSPQTHRIEKAIAAIILREPWYAALLLRLRREESTHIPTASTDGQTLVWNPAFIDRLTHDELIGVLIHEVLHCALLHPFRRGERQMFPWNWACDRVVNAAVLAGGYILPNDCVPPADLTATAEEEYQDLPTVIVLGGIGQDVYDGGSLSDAKDLSEDAKDTANTAAYKVTAALAQEWKEVLAAARGREPTYLKRFVDALLSPIIPWQDVLADFIASKRPSIEHTWSRPHKRVPNCPGHKRIPEYTLAVCVDTSGSVSPQVLTQFLAEVKAITAVEGVSVYALSADAQIHRVYTPGEPWDTWIGGGGTDFYPAIAWAEAHAVDALIYLTDGEGACPKHSAVPTLWALTKPLDMPFGKTLVLSPL